MSGFLRCQSRLSDFYPTSSQFCVSWPWSNPVSVFRVRGQTQFLYVGPTSYSVSLCRGRGQHVFVYNCRNCRIIIISCNIIMFNLVIVSVLFK